MAIHIYIYIYILSEIHRVTETHGMMRTGHLTSSRQKKTSFLKTPKFKISPLWEDLAPGGQNLWTQRDQSFSKKSSSERV